MLCSNWIYALSCLTYMTNIAFCAPIDKNPLTKLESQTNGILPIGLDSLFGGYEIGDLSKYLLIPNWLNAWDHLDVLGSTVNHLSIPKETLKDMTSL